MSPEEQDRTWVGARASHGGTEEKRKPQERQDTKQLLEMQLEIENEILKGEKNIFQKPNTEPLAKWRIVL